MAKVNADENFLFIEAPRGLYLFCNLREWHVYYVVVPKMIFHCNITICLFRS